MAASLSAKYVTPLFELFFWHQVQQTNINFGSIKSPSIHGQCFYSLNLLPVGHSVLHFLCERFYTNKIKLKLSKVNKVGRNHPKQGQLQFAGLTWQQVFA